MGPSSRAALGGPALEDDEEGFTDFSNNNFHACLAFATIVAIQML